MNVTIAIFAVAAILATTVIMTTTIQQALADQVSPNCKPGAPQCKEDQLTQGGLGEFYSKQGKESYYGPDITGKQFGESLSNNAKSDPGIIGSNTAYYGSGECHSDREPKACR